MTRAEAQEFATRWAEHWNRGDVEKVLAHFSADTVFTSPTAADLLGTPTVRGKDALRAYWTSALERIGSVDFTVDRVVWDESSRELAILYTARMAGKTRRVSENLHFGADGQVDSAEVFHGVAAAL